MGLGFRKSIAAVAFAGLHVIDFVLPQRERATLRNIAQAVVVGPVGTEWFNWRIDNRHDFAWRRDVGTAKNQFVHGRDNLLGGVAGQNARKALDDQPKIVRRFPVLALQGANLAQVDR